MYTEYLVQTHTGPVLGVSVSVRHYVTGLVCSVGHVILISSIFSNSCIFPISSADFLISEEMNQMKSSKLESLHIMCGYGCLHLCLTGAGESLSDDDLTRHKSMSIAEYHWVSSQ